MSWYSKIYTKVRETRKRRPVCGWILTKLLNILLIIQLLLLTYAYVFSILIVAGHFVQYKPQAFVYIIVSTSLYIMSIWCLWKTLCTKIARVPAQFKPSRELDNRLRQVSPQENGKFVIEKSTVEEIREQNVIIAKMCEELNITVAECDQVGRIKYCYECCHIKPDRTRHCGSCGICTVKFDHHCPWINQCVNQANYKSFLLYVFYTTTFAYWFALTSLECIIRYFIWQDWLGELAYFLQAAFLILGACVFGYLPLGELVIFHWTLVSLNETTCEQTKPAVLRYDLGADYNLGKAENFLQVFGYRLWFLPVYTSVEDGIYFKIRYLNENCPKKYIRVAKDQGPIGSNSGELLSISSETLSFDFTYLESNDVIDE